MSVEWVDGDQNPMTGARVYRKLATVRAVQVPHAFAVTTLEGVMRGAPGDYLCEGWSGERWPVKKGIFEATYIEVSDVPPQTAGQECAPGETATPAEGRGPGHGTGAGQEDAESAEARWGR